jgi:hypothetical protein
MGMQIQSAATFDWLKLENTSGGGGGIYITAGATDLVTINNSLFHDTGGDAVTCDSGNMTMRYSHMLAATPGGSSGIHCATHFATTGTINMDHNVMENANWGIMASGLNAASKINDNNFEGYGTMGDTGPWTPSMPPTPLTTGLDMTNNYWNGTAAPTNTGATTTTMYAGSKVPNCGPGATGAPM